MKNNYKLLPLLAGIALFASSCQKMDEPALGDYPSDSNPPGGPLKFYAAFDGTSGNGIRDAVDSIRANYPSENSLASVDGVSGKAFMGEAQKFVKYIKPNDFAGTAKAFTAACWYKRDGQTKNNSGTNGPEYLMSFKSNSGHWSGGSFLFFLEGNNAACAVKVMVADATNADSWMTWEGGNTIAGLLDNQWHHIAIVYNNTNSTTTLYIDGVPNAGVRTWGTHGDINFSDAKLTEFRVGAGPGTNYNSDDWLSSSFKGAIDQVRMYGTALTAPEVMALFTSRK
ncbi:MAG TPA: LamG domain-containing protein [Ferruginibacter sp.]|nr:LamG domain-containing protein [Ferruginibacter sp.]HRE62621.1 LamG domain-containing protein [Ferruginibacter sp.]